MIPTAAQILKSNGDSQQVIELNPDAAIQKAMLENDFAPTSPEYESQTPNSDGSEWEKWVAQRGERLDTGEVMYFGCKNGDFATVYWTNGITEPVVIWEG